MGIEGMQFFLQEFTVRWQKGGTCRPVTISRPSPVLAAHKSRLSPFSMTMHGGRGFPYASSKPASPCSTMRCTCTGILAWSSELLMIIQSA
jgi:hypothetical protein